MKFITYRTAKDRENRENGREVEGQIISGAPPTGDWVFCPDEPGRKTFPQGFRDRHTWKAPRKPPI